MPTLKKVSKLIKKTGRTETYWFIVENYTEGSIKKRRYLKNLGRSPYDNPARTLKWANLELARFTDNPIKTGTKSITFREAVELTRESLRNKIGIEIKKNTFDLFEYGISFCLEYLGEKRINEIGYQDIEGLKLWLARKEVSRNNKKLLQNRTINLILLSLSKVFKFCVRANLLVHVPLIDTCKEKVKCQIDRMTKEEIQAMLAIPNPNARFLFKLLLLTGMRPQDAKNLRWAQVNFDQGYIEIISDNRRKRGRKIAITDELAVLLRDFKATQCADPVYVSPYRHTSTVTNTFKKFAATLQPPIKIYCYKIRKTYASIMAENGVDRGMLAVIMGNSVAVGEKYYVDVVDVNHIYLKPEMQKISGVLG